jgi:hypothetical protein
MSDLESRVAAIEEKLEMGTEQFQTIITALGEIKDHLREQDTTISQTKNDVSGIVDMWESGIRGVRFACRAVKAWDWGVSQIVSKRGITLLILVLLVYRVLFNEFPSWTKYAIDLYKFLGGV